MFVLCSTDTSDLRHILVSKTLLTFVISYIQKILFTKVIIIFYVSVSCHVWCSCRFFLGFIHFFIHFGKHEFSKKGSQLQSRQYHQSFLCIHNRNTTAIEAISATNLHNTEHRNVVVT